MHLSRWRQQPGAPETSMKVSVPVHLPRNAPRGTLCPCNVLHDHVDLPIRKPALNAPLQQNTSRYFSKLPEWKFPGLDKQRQHTRLSHSLQQMRDIVVRGRSCNALIDAATRKPVTTT